jgi:transcription termination/antitermination protein NusG
MESYWYVVKVLPGKERKLTEQFNKDIEHNRIKDITRFICPLERETVILRNKRVVREKVLYSGYLYFETSRKLENDDLKVIAAFKDLMSMGGDKTPLLLNNSDIKRILKDDTLEEHIDSKKLKYSIGDKIKVIDGPFNTFSGYINEINGEKITIEVKIFGRNSNVELTISQIEKSND